MMGQIIKKILTDLIFFFFAVLICNTGESSILCSNKEFQPEFYFCENGEVRIWSKMRNIYNYH